MSVRLDLAEDQVDKLRTESTGELSSIVSPCEQTENLKLTLFPVSCFLSALQVRLSAAETTVHQLRTESQGKQRSGVRLNPVCVIHGSTY